MKSVKKTALIGLLLIANIFSCAYINIDMGVIEKGDTGKPVVFKEVTIDESKLDTISQEEALRMLSDVMSSDGWLYTDIDREENGTHIIGNRFDAEILNKIYVDTYLQMAGNFDANYYYTTKTSIGKKTVTVRIEPTEKQVNLLANDLSGYGKGATDVNNFVIVASGNVITTNGQIQPDGKTVKWDTKDAIKNKEPLELTVTYRYPITYLFILAIPAVVLIVYFILRKKLYYIKEY